MTKFCPYCGKQLSARSKFCPQCGKAKPERDQQPAAGGVDLALDQSPARASVNSESGRLQRAVERTPKTGNQPGARMEGRARTVSVSSRPNGSARAAQRRYA